MDETYVRVEGSWKYLYRVVDKAGATADFLLTAKRDRKAALRFLRKAIKWNGTPGKVTIDKSGANTAALESHNAQAEAGIEIRQIKWATVVKGRRDSNDQEASSTPQEFNDQLILFMPKMRVWALALTRNRSAADDLMQDVAAKVLAAQNRFVAGTNFAAWMHRIMINHFISGVRGKREFPDSDGLPDVPGAASHEDRIALRELSWALDRLPADQREALQLIVLQEYSYEDVAAKTGCAVGTLESRVHRARLRLRMFMMGEPAKMAA